MTINDFATKYKLHLAKDKQDDTQIPGRIGSYIRVWPGPAWTADSSTLALLDPAFTLRSKRSVCQLG